MNKYFILISLSFIFFLLFGTTYSQSFNKSWTRTYGNDSVAVVYDVVDMRIDRNNDLYVLGYKDTSSMTSVIVLSKYNQAGQLLFERLYVNPYNMDATPVAIAIDSNNNLYIGGYEQSLIPNHLTDFLVIKYDPSGNFQWKFNFNGITGMEDYLVGLKIDSLNNIYIVGTSYLTGDPSF